MKRFLLLFALLHLGNDTLASVTHNTHIDYWPRCAKIGPRPVILLGFDLDTALVQTAPEEIRAFHSIGRRYAVFMVAPDDRVRLRVEEIHTDQLHYGEVRLVPERPLRMGKTYHLLVPRLEKLGLILGEWNSWSGLIPPAYQIVERPHSADSLVWIRQPCVAGTGVKQSGGRAPCRFVDLDYQLPIPKEEVVIRATLRRMDNGLPLVFFLLPQVSNGLVRLGESPFRLMKVWRLYRLNACLWLHERYALAEQVDYEATFDLLDTYGNELKWTGPPLRFNSHSAPSLH